MKTLLALLAIFSGIASAANPGSTTGADVVEAARLAVRTKQFDEAVRLLRSDAHADTVDAQYLLGLALWNGVGVSADRNAARDSLRRAARRGHAGAAYALAALLATGETAERAESAEWLTRAAAAGYSPALLLREARGGGQRLPMADGRLAPGHAVDLNFEIARFAARRNDTELLAASDVAQLVGRKDEFGRTLLFTAAAAGADAVLAQLLNAGAIPGAVDEYGGTALMLAVTQADVAVTRRLISAGARVETADRAGRTALFHAAAADKPAQIAALLGAGAKVSHVDVQGWTAFDVALQRDAGAAIEALRAHGGQPTQLRMAARTGSGIDASQPGTLYRGWPPLAIAAARDDAADIRRRVSGGADIEAQTPQGDTALDVAIRSRAREAARALLELGANTRHQGRDSPGVMERVVRTGDTALFGVFAEAGVKAGDERASARLLAAAVSRGDTAMTRVLLASGLAATAADDERMTPLMYAARGDHAGIAKLLLDRGAAHSAVDARGRSAIWHAAATASTSVVEVLLAVHAAADTADRDGVTPLLAAIRVGASPVVAHLLAGGVEVDRPGTEKPALRAAAELGQVDIVARLIERKVALDATDEYGDTALMAAARSGNLAICVRLLDAGANPRLRNRDRATAAELAEARGFSALAQRLRG